MWSTGRDVAQSESADRKCAGWNTVGVGYSTRSYKMYKTTSSNYKRHTTEGENAARFQRPRLSGNKNALCFSLWGFAGMRSERQPAEPLETCRVLSPR